MPKKLQQITLGLVVFQLVFWTLIPLLAHHAPPLDATEMYGWSLSFQWGFYKHPPMPPWFLGLIQNIVGRNLFSLFLSASMVIGATYYCVAWLADRFLSEKEAVVALFLYALTAYCNVWSTDFNHNQMQMPFWALSLVCLVKTMDSGKYSWAIMLGCVMGLNALSKYTAALIVPCALVLLIIAPRWRKKIRWQHLVLSSVVFLMVFGPHLYWLTQHHFMPLHYVNERFDELKQTNRLLELLDFVANILLAHVMLILASLYALKNGKPGHVIDQEDRLLVLVLGLGPVVITLVIGLFVPLYSRWVVPMLPMISIVSALFLRGRLGTLYSKNALILFLILQALLGGAYLMKYQINPNQSSRGNYPAPEIARQINQEWQSMYPNHALKIVAGGEWGAGFVSLFSPEKVYVFTQADTNLAPWITDIDIHDCGMVLVEPTPQELDKYPRVLAEKILYIPSQNIKEPIAFHYAILPPQGECQLK